MKKVLRKNRERGKLRRLLLYAMMVLMVYAESVPPACQVKVRDDLIKEDWKGLGMGEPTLKTGLTEASLGTEIDWVISRVIFDGENTPHFVTHGYERIIPFEDVHKVCEIYFGLELVRVQHRLLNNEDTIQVSDINNNLAPIILGGWRQDYDNTVMHDGPVKLLKSKGQTMLELKVTDSHISPGDGLAKDFVYALTFHTGPNQTNEELNQKSQLFKFIVSVYSPGDWSSYSCQNYFSGPYIYTLNGSEDYDKTLCEQIIDRMQYIDPVWSYACYYLMIRKLELVLPAYIDMATHLDRAQDWRARKLSKERAYTLSNDFELNINSENFLNEPIEGIWRLQTFYEGDDNVIDINFCSVIKIQSRCRVAEGAIQAQQFVETREFVYNGSILDPEGVTIAEEDFNLIHLEKLLYPSTSVLSDCDGVHYDFSIVSFLVDNSEPPYIYWFLLQERFLIEKEISTNISIPSTVSLNITSGTLFAFPAESKITIKIAFGLPNQQNNQKIGILTYEISITNHCTPTDYTMSYFEEYLQKNFELGQYVRGQSQLSFDVSDLLTNSAIQLGIGANPSLCNQKLHSYKSHAFSQVKLHSIYDAKHDTMIPLSEDFTALGWQKLDTEDNPIREKGLTYPLWIDSTTNFLRIDFDRDLWPLGQYTFEIRIQIFPQVHKFNTIDFWYPFDVGCKENDPCTETQFLAESEDLSIQIDSVDETNEINDDKLELVRIELQSLIGDQIQIQSLSQALHIDLGKKVVKFGKSGGKYQDYELTIYEVYPTGSELAISLVQKLHKSTLKIGPFTKTTFSQSYCIVRLMINDKKGSIGMVESYVYLGNFDASVFSLENFEDISDTQAKTDNKQQSSEQKFQDIEEHSQDNQSEFTDKNNDQLGNQEEFESEQSKLQQKIAKKIKNKEKFSLLDFEDIDANTILRGIDELEEDDIQVNQINADTIGELFGNKLKNISDRRQQEILDLLMVARLANLKNNPSKGNDTPETKKPDIAFQPVKSDGSFTIFFNKGLAGLDVIKELDKEIKSKGAVSHIYADDLDLDNNDQESSKTELRRQRILNIDESKQKGFDLSSYMAFELKRGAEDSAPPEQLQFSIFVNDLDNDSLYLQTEFENPTMVSIGSKKDVIEAKILDISFFCSSDSDATIEIGTLIKFVLPRMLPGQVFKQILDHHESSMESATRSIMIAQLITTIVLSVSLKQMWNLLNVMQVLAFMRNFTQWPALVESIITQIIEAIYLNEVSDAIMDYGKSQFEVAKQSNKDEFLSEQGIMDSSIIKSLGIFIISITFILLIVLFYFMIRFCNRRCQCCKKLQAMIQNKIFYSGPLRYLIVGYLKLFNQFVSLICFGILTGASYYEFAWWSLIVVILILWPLWSIWFLTNNIKRLKDQSFLKKFSPMYQGIKYNSFLALCYNAVFSVRRFDIVLINIYFTAGSPISKFDRTQYLQKIFCFIFLQLIYLGYVHNVHPHDRSIFNKLEFINEYCMVALAYLMINFTKVVEVLNPKTNMPLPPNQELNSFIEYGAIAIILLMTLVNFIAMIKISFQKILIKCKRRKAEKKLKQSLQKRVVKLLTNSRKSKKVIGKPFHKSIVQDNRRRQRSYKQNDQELSDISLNDGRSGKLFSRSQSLNRFGRQKKKSFQSGMNDTYRPFNQRNFWMADQSALDMQGFSWDQKVKTIKSRSSNNQSSNQERIFGMTNLEKTFLRDSQKQLSIELAAGQDQYQHQQSPN